GGATFAAALSDGTGATTGLGSSPGAGTLHAFGWNYASQAGFGPGATTRTVVRVTPSDATHTGAAAESAAVVVGNDPPALTILSRSRSSPTTASRAAAA